MGLHAQGSRLEALNLAAANLSFRHYTSAKVGRLQRFIDQWLFGERLAKNEYTPEIQHESWTMNSLYEILGLYLYEPHKWVQVDHTLNKRLLCLALCELNLSLDRLCFSESTGAFQSRILNHFKTIPGGSSTSIPAQKGGFLGGIFNLNSTLVPEGWAFLGPTPHSHATCPSSQAKGFNGFCWLSIPWYASQQS